MEQIERSSYFHNSDEVATGNTQVFQELNGKSVYEVIRVQEGIALFLEDHLERLRKSASFIHLQLTDSDEILTERIYRLIASNKVVDQNIKIICNQAVGMLLFFTKTVYPPSEFYETGMHTTLLKLERPDPNLKIQRDEYQKTVLRERQKKGAYEVLLVDQEDYVTEGSRSNLFIVKDGKLFTSPAKNVLLGIVRKKVFEICRKKEIQICEETISVVQLESIDAAFITGTGNNVLPIRSIEDWLVKSAEQPLVKTIMHEYDRMVSVYIEQNRYRK
ncbi:aminotransferase class IV [Desemzia sp. C1]|uniref:aminotransferase class IV n=1 Tax=Desemzia sp. C1 TaxID=2892016 RepID=UPI001E2CA2ED|nr:aminotransferase class IV [Desemzia sp. C1]MCI3029286.1 aminotransferase class IV [Desemzia sp. C1]